MTTQRLGYITSAANPLIVRLRKLARHNAEYRKHGEVLLEGEHLCEAWARRGGAPATHALIAESAWQEGHHVELASSAAAATMVVADALLAQISSLDDPAPISFLVPLPAPAALAPDMATIVLDRVQDPGNVGSILRSAAAFGYGQVLALTGTAALWSAKVLRAGMGAHFALRLIEGAADDALAALVPPLFGTSSHAAVAIDAAPLPWPCAWAFGHEGGGLAPALAARCRQTLRIDQPGGEESLNVAAAAAIALHAGRAGAPTAAGRDRPN